MSTNVRFLLVRSFLNYFLALVALLAGEAAFTGDLGFAALKKQ
jgi:hypothetical protein